MIDPAGILRRLRRRETAMTMLLFVLAAAMRIEHRHVYYDLEPDKVRQITAAGNFVRGRGFSDCYADPADLARIACAPQRAWPPGYPLALALVYRGTHDFLTADVIISTLALLLLLLAAFSLVEAFQPVPKQRSAYHGFLLFSAISFAPYAYLNTTDLTSLALWAAATSLTLHAARKPPALAASALAGTLVSLAAAVRYQYLPLVGCLAGALVLLGVIRRDRRLLASAAACLAAARIVLLALRLSFPANAPVPALARSAWWPGHLRSIDPFAFKAFFFTDPVVTHLKRHLPLLGTGARGVETVGSALVLAGFFTWVWKRRRRLVAGEGELEAFTGLLSAVTVLATVALVVWLSLRVPSEDLPYNHHWTYVWETRYYAPALLLLVVGGFAVAFSPDEARPRGLVRGARLLVGAALVYAVVFDLWTAYLVAGRGDLARTSLGAVRDRIRVAAEVREVVTRDPRPVVVGFETYAEAYAAGRVSGFEFGDVPASRPVVLLVLADKQPPARERTFLRRHQAVEMLALPSYQLYRVDLAAGP